MVPTVTLLMLAYTHGFTLVAEPTISVQIPITLPNGSAVPVTYSSQDDSWYCKAFRRSLLCQMSN